MDPNKVICYDIETDSRWAPYAKLKMVGYQVGLVGSPAALDLSNRHECGEFRRMLASPEWVKIHFNGINFDEVVLARYGYPTNPVNRHDVYLMAKTISPGLPAYGLKFLNWYHYADPHEPEFMLHMWCKYQGGDMWSAPLELLLPYCLHDVVQTLKLFKQYWPNVEEEGLNRTAYTGVELPMGEVLHEMILKGRQYLNLEKIKGEITRIREEIRKLNDQAVVLSGSKVLNAISVAQVARYLRDVELVNLPVSISNNVQCRKSDLLTLLDLDEPEKDKSKLARAVYEARKLTKQLSYLNAFHRAALYELATLANRREYRRTGCIGIPKSYSLSHAKTRRITSSSRFGINFQNQDKRSKRVDLVPPGWLGVWMDATQIENVAHIFFSNDEARRKSYEADAEWNEYVWLCNRILGGNRTRAELEEIPSPSNPAMSVYKQYKTAKLALNFGMGVAKFCALNLLSKEEGEAIFKDVHAACPAMMGLQTKVRKDLLRDGYVTDPFGHKYTGNPNDAWVVTDYLVQGCGTGSVLKVMARAVWETIRPLRAGKAEERAGVICGCTHDEVAFRLSLDLPAVTLLTVLKACLHCMEEKFSPYFDDIPLRAKMSLSLTTAAEQEYLNHHALGPQEWEQAILDRYIQPGKKALERKRMVKVI